MKTFAFIVALGLVSFSNPSVQEIRRDDQGALTALGVREELTLNFSSYGCFSQTVRKLVFVNTGKGIRATLYDCGTVGVTGSSLPTEKIIAVKIINRRDKLFFSRFEKGLKEEREGGCTTQETYTLESKKGKFTVTDASCSWFGFNQLVSDIFGV
ncbi:MAG: hypothetical protein ABWZ25_07145 [Chitinophagaceae bacterium]